MKNLPMQSFACRHARTHNPVLPSIACLTAGMQQLLTDQQECFFHTVAKLLATELASKLRADGNIHEIQAELYATQQILYSLISI